MYVNRPITDYLASARPVLSVEFFPPKNEDGGRQILQTAAELRTGMQPDFVSITYGAGGSTRERTLRYARILKNDYRFQVMPHLTCVGSSREELLDMVRLYQTEGFCNLMLLRGDPPRGETGFQPHPDGLRYAADLVSLVRENFAGFSLGVAGYPEKHPEAPDLETDLAHLRDKCSRGASFVTTQLFFDNRVYFHFVARCRAAGLYLPILPGLLPPLSLAQIQRICSLCQASIPAELQSRLAACGEDPEAAETVGVEWTSWQIRELLQRGAPGIHLYIMNRSRPALRVMQEISPLLPPR